jgi:hypothetical protein
VFRDVPTLDPPPPAQTPLIRDLGKARDGPINQPGTSGNPIVQVPHAVEPPRAPTDEAKERVERRERVLKKVSDLASKRSALARQVADNDMTLVNLSIDHPVRLSLLEEQSRLQTDLTSTNSALRVANLEAEALKELTSSEKRKKKKKKAPKPPSEMRLLQMELEILRLDAKGEKDPVKRAALDRQLTEKKKSMTVLQEQSNAEKRASIAGTSSSTASSNAP